MIQIVCWKWDSGFHTKKGIKFAAKHVNILKSMIDRNITVPYELVCITDDPEGIREDVRIVKLWDDLRDLGGCYTRLKAFSEDMREIIGPRFMWMDLDVVVMDDITPIVMRQEDFIIWGDTNPTTPYNGSLVMMNAGCRKKVWDDFDRHESPIRGRRLGYVGTDQAWIGAKLGEREARFDMADGVYSFRCHIKQKKLINPPKNAKIIFFHGTSDPSKRDVQMVYPWILEHWR
jgi:hypothetical protein